jgi:hypothetical protein
VKIIKRREIFIFSMVATDTFLITAAFVCAYWLRARVGFWGREAGVGDADYRQLYPIVLFSWLTILSMMRQYEPRRRWEFGEVVFSLSVAITIGIVFILAYSFSIKVLY